MDLVDTPTSAIACLSSGLDSSVALALARQSGCDIKGAVTYDYGQRAAKSEIRHAAAIAAHYEIPHRVIALPWFREFDRGGNLLRAKTQLPNPGLRDLDEKVYSEASAKAVWVPNRNGVFLEIAAGLAEDAGAKAVITGFNKEEAATFPDNSEAYLDALTRALFFSTANQVKIFSPTSALDKTGIVKAAVALKFPLRLIWSCYEDREVMCGRCESCMRFKRALSHNEITEVKFADPTLS